MVQITLTTTHMERKEGTKTAYKITETESRQVDENVYNNIATSAGFFRRLGGTVSQVKGYTCAGFKIVKDISTSPDKQRKTIREFSFRCID